MRILGLQHKDQGPVIKLYIIVSMILVIVIFILYTGLELKTLVLSTKENSYALKEITFYYISVPASYKISDVLQKIYQIVRNTLTGLDLI